MSESGYLKDLHGIFIAAPETAVPRGVLAEELQHAIDRASGFTSPQRIAAWERKFGENFNIVWHQGVFRRIASALESDEQSILRFFLTPEDATAFRRAADALEGRLI